MFKLAKPSDRKVFWIEHNGQPVRRAYLGMLPAPVRNQVGLARKKGLTYSYEDGMDHFAIKHTNHVAV